MRTLLLTLWISLLQTFGASTLTTINVGTAANDHTGDSLRRAMQIINSNFALLHADVALVETGTNTLTLVPWSSVLTNAYSPSSWDGSTNPPTQNAVRDEIETLLALIEANPQLWENASSPANYLQPAVANGQIGIATGHGAFTNDVTVGATGEAGLIQISSTNGTYTLSFGLLADGTFAITNNGVLVDTIALNSLYAGGGTLFKSDDGTYKAVTSPPGATVTNININPTDGFSPYRSNATMFGDGPWYRIQSDAMGFGSTNWAFVLNSTNTLVGLRSYSLTSAATENTAFGFHTLNALSSGTANTAFGDGALSLVSSGVQNTADGRQAGRFYTGNGGSFFGYLAGGNATTGTGLTLFGESAGASFTTASRITAFGNGAAYYNLASDATAVGFSAGSVASNLTRAVIIGSQAVNGAERIDKDFTDTIHIGYKASTLTNNTQVVTNSIYIGSNLLPAGPNVIVIGNSSQSTLTIGNVIRTPNTTSVALGKGALALAASADQNTAVGMLALDDATSGNLNTAIGYNNMTAVVDGFQNTSVGTSAMTAMVSGANNVSVGYSSLSGATSDDNVAIGAGAGNTITSGTQNVYVGRAANASGASAANEIDIGYNSTGKGSNTANIGNSSVTVLWLAGSVGWFQGNNTPEGAVTAPVGSFFSRKNGGAGTSFYVKESGTGNTGWVGK